MVRNHLLRKGALLGGALFTAAPLWAQVAGQEPAKGYGLRWLGGAIVVLIIVLMVLRMRNRRPSRTPGQNVPPVRSCCSAQAAARAEEKEAARPAEASQPAAEKVAEPVATERMPSPEPVATERTPSPEPVAEPVPPQPEAPAEAPAEAACAPDGYDPPCCPEEQLTILVAEDNPSNYKLLEVLLKRFRLVYAPNGKEAVELFRSERPHLILMDINMPIMDGYQAVAEIRKLSEQVPIIAITAYAFEMDRQKIMQSGFNAYISKPINATHLKETISTQWAAYCAGKE